jgi:hypothetical protein
LRRRYRTHPGLTFQLFPRRAKRGICDTSGGRQGEDRASPRSPEDVLRLFLKSFFPSGRQPNEARARRYNRHMDRDRPRARHFSMIRDFHLADFLTLANGCCGTAAIFVVMEHVSEARPNRVYAAGFLVFAALVFDVMDGGGALARRRLAPRARAGLAGGRDQLRRGARLPGLRGGHDGGVGCTCPSSPSSPAASVG